jgi:hypothetical protein
MDRKNNAMCRSQEGCKEKEKVGVLVNMLPGNYPVGWFLEFGMRRKEGHSSLYSVCVCIYFTGALLLSTTFTLKVGTSLLTETLEGLGKPI